MNQRIQSLRCPGCHAPLELAAVDDATKCPFCNTLLMPTQRRQSDPEPLKPRVAIPEKLQVEQSHRQLTASWRWFTWAILFLVPFTIFWNGFLVVWYSLVLSGIGPPGAFGLLFVLFPLGHVAVGLGMAYFCLATLLNSTTVEIRDEELRVLCGPLPFPGCKSVPVDDIDQIYLKQDIQSGKNGVKLYYPLLAQLRSGQTVTLLKYNTELELARALEQLIEETLELRDQRVAGEFLG